MTPSLALVPALAPAQQCLASTQETLKTNDSFAAPVDVGVEAAEATDAGECPAAAVLTAAALCAGRTAGAVFVAEAQPARTTWADRTAAHAHLLTRVDSARLALVA